MIEFHPLYKIVIDTFPLSLRKNLKKKVFFLKLNFPMYFAETVVIRDNFLLIDRIRETTPNYDRGRYLS